MCQSCDNAKEPIAVWMCPCGGLLQAGEQDSAHMHCKCNDCGEFYAIAHDKFVYDEPEWNEKFVRVAYVATFVEPSGRRHAELVMPGAGGSGLRGTSVSPDPEPTEHTTPSGVVYVSEQEVPLS